MAALPRVGVRELRQNLSVYLRRVEQGETLEVTDRGRPVARLTPLPASGDPLARLAAEGRIFRMATGDLLDVEPLRVAPPLEKPLSELLFELREEERW